jgi:hypothetical protein
MACASLDTIRVIRPLSEMSCDDLSCERIGMASVAALVSVTVVGRANGQRVGSLS